MSGKPPVCPGCETLATARDFGGIVRWACDTPDCPCAAFDDSENPNPVVLRPKIDDLFGERRPK